MWKERAFGDAEVIFSGSENIMSDFTTPIPGIIAEATIEPAYVRPASILVYPGYSKKIRGMHDLFAPDARIIYNIWQIAHPYVATVVPIEPEFALYRDAGIALTTRSVANPHAMQVYDFVLSPDGAKIFARWGWSA